jgi:hypothetical protein
MATPILYTTVEAIRATLGTDGFDIEDAMIVEYDLETAMLLRLAEFLPTHENVADTDEGEPRLRMWAQYFGAYTFLETAQAAIAKKYAANQDTLERFTIDFQAILDKLALRVRRLEGLMNPALLGPTGLRISLMGISSPDYDPVTGPPS